MSECDHDFSIEENNQYNKCSKCGTWIEYKDIPLYETKRELKEKERQLGKLREAYDFNLDLLSEKERQLEDAREALSSIRGILPTVYSSDREIHEIINKVLKEQG